MGKYNVNIFNGFGFQERNIVPEEFNKVAKLQEGSKIRIKGTCSKMEYKTTGLSPITSFNLDIHDRKEADIHLYFDKCKIEE